MSVKRRLARALVLATHLLWMVPAEAQDAKKQAEANRDRCRNGVLIGGATGFGVLLAVLGMAWRVSDERHRLRLDRLRPARH